MSKTKQIEKMDYEKEVEVSWHSLNADEVLAQLETPVETGLSTAEVKARQEKYGLNELVEKKKNNLLADVVEPAEQLHCDPADRCLSYFCCFG